eukprot:Em0024g315a
MELDRKKEFRTFLAEKFPSVKRGTIGIFYKEFGDKIKAAIKDPSSADKNMRFFVKKKGFQILNIPSLGARDVLVIPVKEQDLVEDNTALDKYRRVAHVEEFYDIIRDVHEKELLHGGYKKTFDKLVSGRPRHPQSEGLVERAHQTIHKKMAAEISASGMKTLPWSDWLPRIVYAMNIQVHDTTGASPYELVFGQKARTVIFPTQQNAIVLEEDLADEGIDHQAFRSEEDANTDVEQDAQCSMSSSHQGSATQNVIDEAEDTLHAEVSAAESETIEREVLEKNDNELNGNELKCNGKRKCLREDALSTSLKHKKIRIKADRKYLSSAKKMAEGYNKQHSTLSFVIGESVSVRIPRIDRASSDLSLLPCVVVEIVGGDQSLYRLRCQDGVLNVCYTAGELEKFNGSVVCTEKKWQNQRFISLREAARKQAPWNHFVSNACKCKTGCLNRKCQCVRKNISCSTYCHKSASCSNCPSSVTGSSIEVVPTACHEDFDPWSKFSADVGDEYLYLHYSEVDDLCEWVLNAREAFEKHTQSAEYPFEHPVESESEEKGIITKRKCSSRTPKLWMTCGELKLYEADRVVLESNQSWLNDNIINAAQTLLKTKVV